MWFVSMAGIQRDSCRNGWSDIHSKLHLQIAATLKSTVRERALLMIHVDNRATIEKRQ